MVTLKTRLWIAAILYWFKLMTKPSSLMSLMLIEDPGYYPTSLLAQASQLISPNDAV